MLPAALHPPPTHCPGREGGGRQQRRGPLRWGPLLVEGPLVGSRIVRVVWFDLCVWRKHGWGLQGGVLGRFLSRRGGGPGGPVTKQRLHCACRRGCCVHMTIFMWACIFVPASGSASAAAATACAEAGSYADGLARPLKLPASPLLYVYT